MTAKERHTQLKDWESHNDCKLDKLATATGIVVSKLPTSFLQHKKYKPGSTSRELVSEEDSLERVRDTLLSRRRATRPQYT